MQWLKNVTVVAADNISNSTGILSICCSTTLHSEKNTHSFLFPYLRDKCLHLP